MPSIPKNSNDIINIQKFKVLIVSISEKEGVHYHFLILLLHVFPNSPGIWWAFKFHNYCLKIHNFNIMLLSNIPNINKSSRL
jgi:hypothetical protein